MKMLTVLLATFALTCGFASAQDVTGFKAPKNFDTTPSKVVAPPNLHPDLKPQLGGVFVDGAKYGTILISPTAPASYGVGAKYLSAPSSRADLQNECGPAAHHDAGGIKLFSIEF